MAVWWHIRRSSLNHSDATARDLAAVWVKMSALLYAPAWSVRPFVRPPTSSLAVAGGRARASERAASARRDSWTRGRGTARPSRTLRDHDDDERLSDEAPHANQPRARRWSCVERVWSRPRIATT